MLRKIIFRINSTIKPSSKFFFQVSVFFGRIFSSQIELMTMTYLLHEHGELTLTI